MRSPLDKSTLAECLGLSPPITTIIMFSMSSILLRLESQGFDTRHLHLGQINGFLSVIARLRPLITAPVPTRRDPSLLPGIPAPVVIIISQHIALPPQDVEKM